MSFFGTNSKRPASSQNLLPYPFPRIRPGSQYSIVESLITNVTCHARMEFNPQLLMNQIELCEKYKSRISRSELQQNETINVRVFQTPANASDEPVQWDDNITGSY